MAHLVEFDGTDAVMNDGTLIAFPIGTRATYRKADQFIFSTDRWRLMIRGDGWQYGFAIPAGAGEEVVIDAAERLRNYQRVKERQGAKAAGV